MSKRILASLLSMVMVGAVLSGCSNGGNAPASSQGGSAAPASSAAASGSQAASDGGFVFNGYPMGQEDQVITWYGGPSYNPNAAYASADDSPFHTILQEMLGVTIEWQFPTAGTEATQAFNLMMAGGTLPDVINHTLIKDAGRYIDEGTIYDLTPYIQEHAPAYYAWLQTDTAYDKAMKTDSGQYYGFGFFREDGGWNDTYLGPVADAAALEEVGLKPDDIKTVSDWDNMLKVLKDAKGGAPLSFAKDRVKTTGISGAFGAYGMIDFQLYIDGNNKVNLAHVQPEYKNYLTKLNDWWKAGYIDQDFISLDDTAVRAKAQNREMSVSITSMGQISNWERDANENNTGAKWIALSYPKSDDGNISMVFGGKGIGEVAGTISTNCPEEKIPLVMRALDYAYTDEGFLYWNFGKEGNSWEYDSNGEPQYLPIVTEDPNGINDAIDKFGGSTWSGNCIQATKLLYLKNTDTAIACNDKWFYENEDVSGNWKMPNGLTYTADESTRNAELQGSIKTYVEEQAVKFITGEESLDNFDNFVSTVEGMGLEELLSINQAAYDRYLAR
ncbi:MAG: hypothetical protein HFG26_00785 [Provencibacterium sp.]|jgi:putative aldouronate transport system substrate-binding protein|nr:hypothetical protein [Provencibacterium sp.]